MCNELQSCPGPVSLLLQGDRLQGRYCSSAREQFPEAHEPPERLAHVQGCERAPRQPARRPPTEDAPFLPESIAWLVRIPQGELCAASPREIPRFQFFLTEHCS